MTGADTESQNKKRETFGGEALLTVIELGLRSERT